jgi:hypothetical protein
MMFRRRPVLAPEAVRALRRCIAVVDRGKDALTSAVPGPRRPGRQVAEALLDFERALGQARSVMPGWRVPETQERWRSCSEALQESARMAERLRLEAPALDFESLVMVLKDLIEPLEVFEEAARLLRGRPGR